MTNDNSRPIEVLLLALAPAARRPLLFLVLASSPQTGVADQPYQ
jgi:hypothetical protein